MQCNTTYDFLYETEYWTAQNLVCDLSLGKCAFTNPLRARDVKSHVWGYYIK